jgi:hypothetical protein
VGNISLQIGHYNTMPLFLYKFNENDACTLRAVDAHVHAWRAVGVACGVWRVACGVWRVAWWCVCVCVWCVVCGGVWWCVGVVWCVVWCVVCGVWCVVWCVVCGVACCVLRTHRDLRNSNRNFAFQKSEPDIRNA